MPIAIWPELPMTLWGFYPVALKPDQESNFTSGGISEPG